MQFNRSVLLQYMASAPFALAFERSLECKIYESLRFERPILDVGCGEGLFAKIAFAERIDTGIDPNDREIERASQLGSYDELITCWGNEVPKPTGYYKTILSNSVLEHIPDIKPVLVEINRLLAPDGMFYMTVPSDRFDQYTVLNTVLSGIGLRGHAARYRKFFNSFWKHYHYYSLECWRELAQSCGFTVMDAYTYDPKRICLMNDFLAPFGAFELVVKRLTNRWVLFPTVRRLLVYPAYIASKRILKGGERAENGGLVFLAMTKGAAT